MYIEYFEHLRELNNDFLLEEYSNVIKRSFNAPNKLDREMLEIQIGEIKKEFINRLSEPKIDLPERNGCNIFYSIDDLPFTDEQKTYCLEWLARKLWVILEESSGEPDYYGKMYDPLYVELEDKKAHSYVFDLEDGGRHHKFTSLSDLEKQLIQEAIKTIKRDKLYGKLE